MGRTFTQGWGTEAEIEFLNHLGSLGKEGGQPKDRRKCLLGYAKAFPMRVKWGAINSYVVKNHLLEILKKDYDEDIEI
jgi:hypothetical protein